MDPARPTRFEKKKNMLPNVPHKHQFHVWDVVGAPRQNHTRSRTESSHGTGYVKAPEERCAEAVSWAGVIFPGAIMCKTVSPPASK